MEIAKNKTRLDGRALWSFQLNMMLRNLWIILLASAIVVLCAFRVSSVGEFYLDSLWVLIIGACCTPAYIIISLISYAIADRKFKPVDLEYTFHDDKIVVEGVSETAKESIVINFDQITRIHESGRYLFMYVAKHNELLVDKSGFSEGDATKVKELLKLNIKRNKEIKKSKKTKIK